MFQWSFICSFVHGIFYCVFWNSVSSVHSPQLQYHHPAVRSHYGTIASDVFERYKYPTSSLGENSEDSCNCRCEYSKTLDDSLHRWTSPVNGWYRTRRHDDNWHQVVDVNNDCRSSNNTCSCFSPYIDDSCCHSSVKRHAQLFSEFPAAHCCEFYNVTQGSCACVHDVWLACIDVQLQLNFLSLFLCIIIIVFIITGIIYSYRQYSLVCITTLLLSH